MDLILSLLVLAALAMAGGAYLQWRRGARKHASLMLVLAVVMIANVLIDRAAEGVR